jgi:hypothetical protein
MAIARSSRGRWEGLGYVSSQWPAAALTCALFTVPSLAVAQAGPPTRDGNVWDWRVHQPTEAQVQRRENEVGIAPSRAQVDRDKATLDRLNRQLLRRSEDW